MAVDNISVGGYISDDISLRRYFSCMIFLWCNISLRQYFSFTTYLSDVISLSLFVCRPSCCRSDTPTYRTWIGTRCWLVSTSSWRGASQKTWFLGRIMSWKVCEISTPLPLPLPPTHTHRKVRRDHTLRSLRGKDFVLFRQVEPSLLFKDFINTYQNCVAIIQRIFSISKI